MNQIVNFFFFSRIIIIIIIIFFFTKLLHNESCFYLVFWKTVFGPCNRRQSTCLYKETAKEKKLFSLH